MPEEAKKTVDIDTSGPAMDVDIPEVKDESSIEEKEVVQKEESTIREVVEEKEPVEEKETAPEKDIKEDKDELKDYSDSVQKRIAKLTKKWREAERQKDEALSYAQRVIKDKKDTEAKLKKIEPNFLSVTEEGITTGIEAAKAQLAAAREAQDLGAEATAMAKISELGYKQAKLNETKEAQAAFEKQQAEKKPEPTLGRQMPAKSAPDPKAESWSENNPWFGQDTAMTYTAFDLHKKLVEAEGFDPSSDEYYKEIDKRIRLEFPHKFDKKEVTESTKPPQTVASAKRSGKTGRKTVRLTPSQVTIAKKLGVPLEEYAKQLNITKEA
tara:strand:- start:1147 stop:2124 length:978 start_codon:yes stop_codon:yes gene_type:complete